MRHPGAAVGGGRIALTPPAMSVRLYSTPELEDALRAFCRCGLHLLLTEKDDPALYPEGPDFKLRASCHFDRLGISNASAFSYQYREPAEAPRVNLESDSLPDLAYPLPKANLHAALSTYFNLWYNVVDNNGDQFLGGRDERFERAVRYFAATAFGGMDRFYAWRP